MCRRLSSIATLVQLSGEFYQAAWSCARVAHSADIISVRVRVQTPITSEREMFISFSFSIFLTGFGTTRVLIWVSKTPFTGAKKPSESRSPLSAQRTQRFTKQGEAFECGTSYWSGALLVILRAWTFHEDLGSICPFHDIG